MSKLICTFVFMSCLLASSAIWGKANCPDGSVKIYGCRSFFENNSGPAQDEVLVVCKSENRIEYILENDPISIREEVIFAQNPYNKECQDYTPVSQEQDEDGITMHTLSVCTEESTLFSYVWLGGTIPQIFVCN